MTEVNVNEFAVKLKICKTKPAAVTFRDETRRHFELIKGMAGKDIELSELINSNHRVTVIHGVAGIGKSVLTKQIAVLWANNAIYTQFKLCVVIECREINHFVANEGAEVKKHEVISQFLKSKFTFDLENGASTLIILDGLDELSDINDENSVIWQLIDIKNTKYPMAKIILTGRPHIESKLEEQNKDIGGMHIFEIQGLNDEQIKEYVKKFTAFQEDVVNIDKTIDSFKEYIAMLSVPEFLNSLCCVTMLSNGGIPESAVELYVWVLYLLLNQHGEKERLSQKQSSKIFNEYSKELLALCEICYELLNENRIIFKGNVKSRLLKSGKGTIFIEGLFANVSDNRTEKYQFKHSTLMEFLSAVHICRMKNREKAIENNLKNGFYQVVLFSCQLLEGCKHDGIIKDMFANDEELKAINVQQLLSTFLKLIGQCTIEYEHGELQQQQQQQQEQLLKLSIDIITCLTNINENWDNMRNVSEICDHLVNKLACTERDLKETLKNLRVERVYVYDAKSMTFMKYLPNVKKVEFQQIKTNVPLIRKTINEVARCKGVVIYRCDLAGDEVGGEDIANHELEDLFIYQCTLDKSSFTSICNWAIASSVTTLYDIHNIEHSWWEELSEVIANAKERKDGSLGLEKLVITKCTHEMNEDVQRKVRRFNY